MERRYAQFIAISLAIILLGQLLQARLFPKPPRRQDAGAAARQGDDPDGRGERPRGGPDAGAAEPPSTADTAVEDPSSDGLATDDTTSDGGGRAPRARRTLGSLDPAAPAGMLVTLTSRGAAVERIELSGERFHDQDDRSGYLGHLAAAPADGGSVIGVVGPGTPADKAGLRAGDVIRRVAGTPTGDPLALHAAVTSRRPGESVAVEFSRDGQPRSCDVVLDRRPLEVVRPEFRSAPVTDPDAQPCDPLSFRLSLGSRDGRRRPEPLLEIPGQQLADADWRLEEIDGGAGVRFTRRLRDGLTVAKEYRLVPPADPAADGPGHRLELTVEIAAADRPTRLTYSLDGPTGLPTEGWWYTSRVAHDWGALAVRDVALRFSGEQTTLVSGLKMAEGKLDREEHAIRDGKPLSFAGVDALYFAAALVPETTGPEAPALEEVRPLVVGEIPAPARRKLVDVTCRLVSRDLDLASGAAVRHRYGIFAGPKKPGLLARHGMPGARMDDLVYFGWFGWVARPMIALLHALHAVIGNYGVAIVLLTVLVRSAMFPVSRKQALATQKMQVLQPEMKAIAEKYQNDPQKRTQATQELWRKHDYNPMGGCLLAFVQIPIFIGLYRSLATDVELRQAPLFSDAIRWCSNLAAPDMLWDWSRYLPGFLVAPEGWLGPFLNVFPLLTIGLFLWQQHLFMPPAVDEQSRVQQQVMQYMMFFMALMFFKVPCGLCLYFIASSIWGIAERLWLPHTLPAIAAASGAGSATSGAGSATSGAGSATAAPRRVIDVPFTAFSRKEPGPPPADAARRRRESRRRQR